MNVILVIGSILSLYTVGLAYITLKVAKSEESELINEIQIKYPNSLNYQAFGLKNIYFFSKIYFTLINQFLYCLFQFDLF